MKQKIINVISGKGGTGKTLLIATLSELLANEDKKILVIDLDIFVRGISSIFYLYKNQKNLLENNELSVENILLKDDSENKTIGIKEYKKNFFIIPSVKRIDRKINFKKLNLINHKVFKDVLEENLFTNKEEVKFTDEKTFSEKLDSLNTNDLKQALKKIVNLDEENFIKKLHLLNYKSCKETLEKILESEEVKKEKFDYIFIDNRAGYDEFVLASHEKGNLSINIAEDDKVSNITSKSLIKQLEEFDGNQPIITIVNKLRDIKTVEDLNKEYGKNNDIRIEGFIPFDMDVMKNFGKDNFLKQIKNSLYIRGLITAWNNIAETEWKKEGYKIQHKTSQLPFEKIFSVFNSSDRFSVMIGSFIMLISIVALFLNNSKMKIHNQSQNYNYQNINQDSSNIFILLLVVGFILSLLPYLKKFIDILKKKG